MINSEKKISNWRESGKHNYKDDNKRLGYFKDYFERGGALNQILCRLAIK